MLFRGRKHQFQLPVRGSRFPEPAHRLINRSQTGGVIRSKDGIAPAGYLPVGMEDRLFAAGGFNCVHMRRKEQRRTNQCPRQRPEQVPRVAAKQWGAVILRKTDIQPGIQPFQIISHLPFPVAGGINRDKFCKGIGDPFFIQLHVLHPFRPFLPVRRRGSGCAGRYAGSAFRPLPNGTSAWKRGSRGNRRTYPTDR